MPPARQHSRRHVYDSMGAALVMIEVAFLGCVRHGLLRDVRYLGLREPNSTFRGMRTKRTLEASPDWSPD
jgi:hypothetical protein